LKGAFFEPFIMFFNAAWNTSLGKVQSFCELWKQVQQVFVSGVAKELAGQLLALEAYDEASLGYESDARQKLAQAVGLSNDPETRTVAAMAWTAAGDAAKSASLLESAMRDTPDNHFIQTMVGPQVLAMQQLARNQAAESVNTLETLRNYEFGTGPRALGATPVYVRGLAYLKLHDGAKAGAEFQRILDHRGATNWGIEYPLAQLNLGRAYAMQGDTAKARTAYQDFFALWKEADADVPVLKTARAEYENLK
jgi:tetratricopeptide (TPR) repeat protein